MGVSYISYTTVKLVKTQDAWQSGCTMIAISKAEVSDTAGHVYIHLHCV